MWTYKEGGGESMLRDFGNQTVIMRRINFKVVHCDEGQTKMDIL
jgi:hypothetical protein